jgi:Tol biopolymer transport system component
MRFSAAGLAVFLWVTSVASPARSNETRVGLREGTNFAVALAPDGGLVSDLQGTIWRIPPTGGASLALTDGLGDDRLPDVARDGSRIVFQSYRNGTWDVWSMSPDGTSAIALTEGPSDDREPVLSPDGGRVAFSSDRSGNYDVFVLDIESGALTQLTSDVASDFQPAWMPSGEEVVFVSEREPAGLYAVSSRTPGEPRRVGSLGGSLASPSVSPDGKLLAVRVLEMGESSAGAMGRAAVSSRLAVVTLPGGESRFLQTAEDVFPFRAQWPGPGEILFTAGGSIWRGPIVPGAELTRIPFEAEVVLDRAPYARRPVVFPKSRERVEVRGIVRLVVSPDGTRIAYSALGDVWVVPSDGGEPLPLTRDEHLDTDPHWSPDGRSIVFSSDRHATMDLWIKDAGAPPGSGERRLTSDIGAEILPSWSPDGRTIAYVDWDSRLHVVSVDGTGDRVLTEPRRGIGIPSWSSDSRHVAVAVHVPISTRFREGYNRILVVDTQTGDSRLLQEPGRSIGTRDGDGPVWRPDGGALAFAMDGGLWTLPVTPAGEVTGRPTQIAGEAVDYPSWSGDGSRVFFLGASGISSVDVSNGEVSRVDLRHDYEVSAAGGRLRIRNVRIVDGTGAPGRDGQDVFIEGERIVRIEPTGTTADDEVRVVDGTGKTLIPGLIEMHAHFGLPAWGSRHGKVWLAFGVTSVRSPADALYRVLEERESIFAGRRVGPRIFFTGGTMDGDRIYYTGALAVSDPEELEQEMKRALDLELDLIKTYVRLPDALQKEAVGRAHARGVFVTSHEVYPAVAFGVDGIEHVRGTSRRGYSPKITDLRRTYDDVVELIARSKAFFTPTVLIHGGYDLALAREPGLLADRRIAGLFPPFVAQDLGARGDEPDPEGSKAAIVPVFDTIRRIHERGGRVIAGTDSPIVPYGMGLLLEIEQLAESGLGPMAALESATRVAAEALGAEKDLGTVEVGKVADLVLLAGDPIEDMRNLRRTEMIVIRGRLLSVDQLLRSR